MLNHCKVTFKFFLSSKGFLDVFGSNTPMKIAVKFGRLNILKYLAEDHNVDIEGICHFAHFKV